MELFTRKGIFLLRQKTFPLIRLFRIQIFGSRDDISISRSKAGHEEGYLGKFPKDREDPIEGLIQILHLRFRDYSLWSGFRCHFFSLFFGHGKLLFLVKW